MLQQLLQFKLKMQMVQLIKYPGRQLMEEIKLVF